jgi:hypothetical protein
MNRSLHFWRWCSDDVHRAVAEQQRRLLLSNTAGRATSAPSRAAGAVAEGDRRAEAAVDAHGRAGFRESFLSVRASDAVRPSPDQLACTWDTIQTQAGDSSGARDRAPRCAARTRW